MHSSSHRKALVKALSKMSIETAATPEALLAKVTEKKHGVITFSDEDLPLEGQNHNKTLFISTEVRGKKTNYMMDDDGSAINVCPLKILPNLDMKVDDLTNSDLIIRAYDDSTKSVEGTFQILVKMGPVESMVEFIVLDILVTYTLLL